MAEEFEQLPLPQSVGDRLREARESRELTLAQVAAETRIPQRHLQTSEAGDFAALPARTYAISFAKNYARMVGLDQAEVAAEVRAELDAQDPNPRHRPAGFEPLPPNLVKWRVSPLDPALRRVGVRYAAFTTRPPPAIAASLRPILTVPVSGFWLYELP